MIIINIGQGEGLIARRWMEARLCQAFELVSPLRQAKRTGHRVGGSQEESWQAAEKAEAAAEAAQAKAAACNSAEDVSSMSWTHDSPQHNMILYNILYIYHNILFLFMFLFLFLAVKQTRKDLDPAGAEGARGRS